MSNEFKVGCSASDFYGLIGSKIKDIRDESFLDAETGTQEEALIFVLESDSFPGIQNEFLICGGELAVGEPHMALLAQLVKAKASYSKEVDDDKAYSNHT